jgi:2-polyprenyl-6-methoxyphenol hydroxylase-like FAD-dependent oxidoreductase
MTPNLGQGGCTALEDSLVLARCLQQQGAPALAAALQQGGGSGSSGGSQQQQVAAAAAVRAALRQYEWERATRCLPLTVRSHVMGAVLQVRGSSALFAWRAGLPACR